ncbi:hypothetical protein EDB81DRAFT_344252 [Dactylonectria macrodidyma]|uniref:Golgi apparatus membrane protein TVP18 n=1 Tax=Dactylonectria macrodidyma TaxID=307937 RepID=A0A9P9FGG5_9HYPO|nr:hypothetical protein EDB81DRAFT_344252 [Dactylonectria macrodidyma]
MTTMQLRFDNRLTWEYPYRFGILSMIICLATGISTIFSFHAVRIVFCALAIASAFIILFVEVPLLLRICPTSSKFDAAIRKISTNYTRAAAYAVMGALQFVSILTGASALVAAGVFLIITAICYGLAGIKGQAFVGSKTLGGQGVAQMIV